LNQIPHPWTLIGSDLVYSSLDSPLLELKILIPLWTWTPSQFGLVSSIFFLSSPGQLTRVTFTLSAYPIDLPKSHPNSLPKLQPSTLSEPHLIASMLTWPYTLIPGRITLPDSSPDRTSTYSAYMVLPGRITSPNLFLFGLLPTRLYPATIPDFLTRPGNTSLHPTAYWALPNHLARPGTLQLASPENLLIILPPWLRLVLVDNASR
jgi:hypothetical protein